jgi:hypothetical protein
MVGINVCYVPITDLRTNVESLEAHSVIDARAPKPDQ